MRVLPVPFLTLGYAVLGAYLSKSLNCQARFLLDFSKQFSGPEKLLILTDYTDSSVILTDIKKQS